MTIEEEIIAWVRTRPIWQQNVVAKLARGEIIDDVFVTAIAEGLVNGNIALADPPMSVANLPRGTGDSAQVILNSVGNLANVNALISGQTLTFGVNGLTIVYGDNASGKSGYARLLKTAAGARHKQPVLPNVFDPSAGTVQSGSIVYSVSGDPREEKWPCEDNTHLRSVHFHDEACGDQYIDSDTELMYRPSVLKIFDDLVAVADQVRKKIDDLLVENASHTKQPPQFTNDTKAATFIRNFSVQTADEAVRTACSVNPEDESRLSKLVQEEARIRTTNPATERARLRVAASNLLSLAKTLDVITVQLGTAGADAAVALFAKSHELRTAANQASLHGFANEPVSGVGTTTWRALWSAAEAFVEANVHPDSTFPPSEPGMLCPLCQQVIGDAATDRLSRFHQFVHNAVEKDARQAEANLRQAITDIEALTITSTQNTAAIVFIENDNQPLAQVLSNALEGADRAKARLLERLKGTSEDVLITLSDVDAEALRGQAKTLEERAAKIDDSEFIRQVAEVAAAKNQIGDRIQLSKHRDSLLAELVRLRERSVLEKARTATNTSAITTKSSDLARQHVTAAVIDWFTRESDRLQLEKVVLGDRGGSKGKLRHKPALIGAVPAQAPSHVLSEGEKTALGLAGLFTEIHFDDSKSAVILDDPVSSLDHQRRKNVAKRITEIAADRQVVVFTHDLSFAGYLDKAAETKGVPLTRRTIQRNGDEQPGVVIDEHPWKAKDAAKRLDALKTALAKIKKERHGWDEATYVRETSLWAGGLSETWERLISSEVVNQVVDRATTEVRPRMVRMLAKITEEDNQDFQEGYGEVSEWAARHDKSEDTNYVAPTLEQMETELDRIMQWFRRIKSYRAG